MIPIYILFHLYNANHIQFISNIVLNNKESTQLVAAASSLKSPPELMLKSTTTASGKPKRNWSTLSPTQKKAEKHLNNMQVTLREAMAMMQQFKKSELEPYTHPHGRYPENFTGLCKCHLRSLWNIIKKAAMEASSAKTHYINIRAVNSILKAFQDGVIRGAVFFIHQQHWVSLRRLGENNDAVYYDDKVMMKLNNYEGAVEVLAEAQEKPKTKKIQ